MGVKKNKTGAIQAAICKKIEWGQFLKKYRNMFISKSWKKV